jgi:hypothetical protein
MGLSNEATPNNSVVETYLAKKVLAQAAALAGSLTRCERNPCPTDPREAQHPARNTRIRRWVPVVQMPVDQSCKDQNSRTASLGHPELFSHLWGEHG